VGPSDNQATDADVHRCYAICPFFASEFQRLSQATQLSALETTIFDLVTLTFLSGIPLTPIELCVQAMLYTACRPKDTSGAGGIIMLPDGGSPSYATPEEYDPLDQGWGMKMSTRSAAQTYVGVSLTLISCSSLTGNGFLRTPGSDSSVMSPTIYSASP
jgi:hypothetical protein